MISAAQAIVKALEIEGVNTVFGYPGAAICPLYDELSRSDIRHILVRQEQNAGHAANGYARVTGRAGVCITTSGPGATNLITALATAYMDSIPLVAITGQVSTELLGRDVFQEADITGAAEPFTKHSFLVKQARELPRILKEAFYIASTGRQGPVLVDVPVDVQNTMIAFDYPAQAEIRGYKPSSKGNAAQLGRVLDALRLAVKPVICAGGGVFGSGAVEQVRKLAESHSIPVVSTMMGIGVMPSAHPLYFGMVGMHGGAQANYAVQQSDLLIIIGARAGDRAMQNPGILKTRIVHIDIDPAEIGKNMETSIPLVGDARQVLEQLLEQSPRVETASWLDELRARGRAAFVAPAALTKQGVVSPVLFLSMLSAKMDDDGIFVADVGQNQIWSAHSVKIRSGRFLTSCGMGTMGYALPAAIGAKLAAPEKQVVAVCGDGSFQMQMMELATLCQHNAPVKLVVLCNNRLGMVREVQQNTYGGSFAVSLDGSPDVCRIAQAYGIPSASVRCDSEAEAAVDAMLGSSGAYILQCAVDPEEPSISCTAFTAGGSILHGETI